jgi:hypothetical protein
MQVHTSRFNTLIFIKFLKLLQKQVVRGSYSNFNFQNVYLVLAFYQKYFAL